MTAGFVDLLYCHCRQRDAARLSPETSRGSFKRRTELRPGRGEAGFAEYWVLDVSDKRLIAHRGPMSGAYTSVVVYSEVIAPLAAPQVRFRVADAFAK